MKRSLQIVYLLVAVAFFTWGCKTQSKSPKAKLDRYEEDLSEYRPTYDEGPVVENPETPELEVAIRPTHHVNEELTTALDSIALYNSESNYVNGYKIQVFLGKSREQALETRDKLLQVLPDQRPDVEYDQPNYKVKVGSYTEKMEAQKTYMKLKKEFPTAIIIPAKIWVSK